MLYRSYRTAAERHLEVCLQLVGLLDVIKAKEVIAPLSPMEETDRDKLLADLYYLSGYIIECSYCCAIYHYIAWGTTDVRSLKPANNNLQIAFRANSTVFTIFRQGSAHSMVGNMHFFQTVAPMANVSTIPLIGYTPVAPVWQELFDNWSAEIRYEIDPAIILNYNTAYSFFFVANEIYEGLLKNSMI